MKIAAKFEGRQNIYLPDKASLKAWLEARHLEKVHHFSGGPTFIGGQRVHIGADHSVSSVLDDIEMADRLSIFTDSSNLGHALAIVRDGQLDCYDIGPITLMDLDLGTQERDGRA